MACRVKLVIEGEIATTHIIERLVAQALGGAAHVSKIMLAGFLPDHLRGGEMPILVRIGDPVGQPMLKWMIERGLPFIYYIDDNFWELEGRTPLARFYQSRGVRTMLALAIQHAGLVIVNSALLGKYIEEHLGVRPLVLPAPFDFSLVDSFEAPHRQDEQIRIGFAGSPTRAPDFLEVTPALQRILADFPQTELHFFGYLPDVLRDHPRVHFTGHVADYESFIRLKRRTNLDIGLAPMAPVKSNLYKTNNKYREYGALGVAGVYADTHPYKDSVKHAETGFLVQQTADGWYEGIAELIRDPQLRKRIAERACSDVRRHYAQDVVALQWRDVLLAAADKWQIALLTTTISERDHLSIKRATRMAVLRIRLRRALLRCSRHVHERTRSLLLRRFV
ncbi:glycosyltransferase [Paraburkholderia domus]|uniref:glycosyltransferase n=1 Tax=Paraburkholderia domus TaxID=2793075 RepID=UPI00191490B2|nr:glycosyltransferase [Paraburkholderia domus]MBK5059616.1 glycosyltransferase family 4 protein [Burkholderia sp. R-70199]CAE6845172.1 hypothetical protein R70199_00061 [Paraburkholderia domus]